MLCHVFGVIPNFLETGLLPKGIHWASAVEVHSRFGTNAHRRRLLGGLHRAMRALMTAGCKTVYVDGSFVTSKELPKDYDVAWDASGVIVAKLDPVFDDFSNERAAQKAKYLGEFFPAHYLTSLPPSPAFRTYLEFLQIDKDTGDSKGIIGINMKATP